MKCADLHDCGAIRVPTVVSSYFSNPGVSLFSMEEPMLDHGRYAEFMAVLRRDNPKEFARKVLVNIRGGGQ